jgi:hypothetical protein
MKLIQKSHRLGWKCYRSTSNASNACMRYSRLTTHVGCLLQMGYMWYEHIYKLDKVSYNKLHPYTSWIPITYAIFPIFHVCRVSFGHPAKLHHWLALSFKVKFLEAHHIDLVCWFVGFGFGRQLVERMCPPCCFSYWGLGKRIQVIDRYWQEPVAFHPSFICVLWLFDFERIIIE